MKVKEWLATQGKDIEVDLISSIDEMDMVYTIVENPLFWTQEFQEHFAYILKAEILHQHQNNGYDTLVIDVEADLIETFSAILAGYCSSETYDGYRGNYV